MIDGTSNTVLFAERYRALDGEHVLPSVEHAGRQNSSGEDSRGLWQINLASNHCGPSIFDIDRYDGGTSSEDDIRKGGWISDVTYEALPGGTAVAMETLTIAHEGVQLF